MVRSKHLPLAALLLATAACAPQQPPVLSIGDPASAPRADVNPDYRPGRLNMPNRPTMSLAEMQNVQAAPRDRQVVSDADRLRAPALRDAALAYGARGGLAWASKQMNEMLEARAAELSRTYDFNRFLIRAQGGDVKLLPPVISESRDTYEQQDAGRTLRAADRYYQILEQARFAPVAPLWHTYLVRTYTPPERPSDDFMLPKNDGERDLWKRFVAEGWEKGVEQAREIFRNDLRRLERDYTGMIRYSELLEKGMVSAPVVADQNLGVTGSGQNMRQNDRVYRITQDPRLNVQRPGDWQAPVSGADPTEAATPPGRAPGVRDD